MLVVAFCMAGHAVSREDAATTSAAVCVPWHGLIPADIVGCLYDQQGAGRCDLNVNPAEEISAGTGASVDILTAETLSDSIVRISASSPEKQRAACHEVLSRLRKALGSGDAEEAFFVVLVPSSAAGAVVGTRGQRIQSLCTVCGARIDVGREILDIEGRLNAQPVSIQGSMEQVLSGVQGVYEVLQELIERGRHCLADFAIQERGTSHGETSRPVTLVEADGCEVATSGGSHPVSPVILLVGMDVAGWLIGKQASRAMELQRSSGAQVRLANNGVGLPGMRCGTRLLEITAQRSEVQAAGVRAVFAALSDAPSDIRLDDIQLVVPSDAAGYVIGTNGQSLQEITSRTGVEISIHQEVAIGLHTASFAHFQQRSAVECGEAVLALVVKVEELRERQAAPRMPPRPETSASKSLSTQATGVLNGQLVSSSEQALLAGIQASGVLNHQAVYSSEQALLAGIQAAGMLNHHTAKSSEQALLAGIQASGVLEHQAVQSSEQALLAGIKASGVLNNQTALSSERALLAGIRASGVCNHKLVIQVPRALLTPLDIQEVERRSGARLEVTEAWDHVFVSAIGPRLENSLAVLYLQEAMAAAQAM